MSEWISVKDRLPESNQPVIVYSESRDSIMISYYLDGQFTSVLIDWNTGESKSLVTHWMPLPSPPKDK